MRTGHTRQEGHCKTQLTRFLLPTFSFYESSNDHQKFWLINQLTPYCKTAKPNGTVKGEKPDLRILGQGGHVATVEIKVRPSFGSSAQLGGNGIESDLEQLCAGSAQIFLLGATDHWWSRIAVRFPGLCPPTQSVVPSTSVQTITLQASSFSLKCASARCAKSASVFAAWYLS